MGCENNTLAPSLPLKVNNPHTSASRGFHTLGSRVVSCASTVESSDVGFRVGLVAQGYEGQPEDTRLCTTSFEDSPEGFWIVNFGFGWGCGAFGV